MATLAQALELKKKNPNLSTRDAIAQVEGIGTSSMNTANPPVTPPTPTPTGQTMQGVNNETFQVAPINQQTGLSTPTQTQAPTQPTSTTTPTQTAPIQAQNTPTPESTIAGIQTPTSTPEVKPTPIKSPEELKREEISAKNKAQIELNRQKSELAREDRKLQTDEANNALANDETAILNTLKSGGIIPEVVKTSPYYKSAQNTYRQIQNFRTMSQSQLSTALSNGSLLP